MHFKVAKKVFLHLMFLLNVLNYFWQTLPNKVGYYKDCLNKVSPFFCFKDFNGWVADENQKFFTIQLDIFSRRISACQNLQRKDFNAEKKPEFEVSERLTMTITTFIKNASING